MLNTSIRCVFLLHEIGLNKQIQFVVQNEEINFLDHSDNSIHLHPNTIESFDTVFHLLLSFYDTNTNYGLIYGLATYVSNALSFLDTKQVYTSDTIAFFLNDEKKDLMDLTYPTFDDAYTLNEDIEYVERLANQFVRYVIETDGYDTLKELISERDYDIFEQYYKMHLNNFIKHNALDFKVEVNEYPIFFDRDIKNNHSVWYTKHASWYLSSYYETYNPDKVIYGNLLMSNYRALKEAIISFEIEMDKADNLLKDISIDYRDLRINIQGSSSGESYYTAGSIYLSSISFLNHEYLHYLTFPYMEKAQWLREAVAYYYDFAYDFNYFDQYYKYFYEYILSGQEYAPIEFMTIRSNTLDFYRDKFGENPNLTLDKMIINDIFIYLNNEYDGVYMVYEMGVSNYQYVSFVNYFIEIYSEEFFLELIRDDSDLIRLTGKSWADHVHDWEMHIKSIYNYNN